MHTVRAAGQLQLSAFEPVIAHSLLRSLTHLRAACDTLARQALATGRMVKDLTAEAGLLTTEQLT